MLRLGAWNRLPNARILALMSAKQDESNVEAQPIRLLSRRQVGAMCGVHEGTVKRWEFSGHLKAVKINARVTRYPEEEVRRFIAQAAVA